MINLPQAIYEQLLAHLQDCYPAEACGFLAGSEGLVSHHYPVASLLASRTAYQMEPAAQLEALQEIEAHGRELLAIYHSHPHTPARPSARDRQQWHYPEAAMIIVSLVERQRPQIRAYRFQAGRFIDCPLAIV
jgi:[CysO sulfur-carrier protein]-S-L-cysteine hydrolase